MDVLNKKIDDLQIAANDSSLASCTVTTNGDVKCTNIVYNNPKVWKFSQNRVQKQISNLQSKLEKLKELQKHLETNRPNFEDDEDDDDGENGEENENEEDSGVNLLLTNYSQIQLKPRSVIYIVYPLVRFDFSYLFKIIHRMIPEHNYSMSLGSLLVDGVELHRLKHHYGNNKPQSRNEDEDSDGDDDQDQKDSVINLFADYSQTQLKPKSVTYIL